MIFDRASEVQIHLTTRAKWAARLALYRDGKLSWGKAMQFQGPHFKDTKDTEIEVAVGQSTVNVVVIDKRGIKPDVEYIYPLASTGRIKITA